MAIITSHPNVEVDLTIPVQDVDVIGDSEIQQKLDDLIDKLGTCDLDSESFEQLIDVENDHDGRISRLMAVYYKHLNALLDKKMIDKVTYGQAVIELLSRATDTSLRTYEFDKTLCRDNAKIIADLAQSKVDLVINELKKYMAAYEIQDIRYKIDVFNPLTRETMKEDVFQKHVDHELSKFDLDNMKPQELLVLKEKVKSSVADRLAKEYYQANVQPKELEKLDAETDLLRFDVDNMKPQELLVLQEEVKSSIADRLAKEYYQQNVQPKELEKLDAETDTLRFDVDNMKPQELLVLQEQVKMSIAEREAKEYYTANVQPKELEKLDAETDTLRYIIDNMKPQELLVLKEQVKMSIADRRAKEFDIDNMKPQELLVLQEQVKMSIADRQVKEFDINSMKPKELEKLDAETDTLRYIIDNMKPQELLVLQEQVRMSIADRQAKEYYTANIQPCEKDLTCAKATIEKLNAGLDGNPSLPELKHAQIAAQTELYEAEIGNYEDKRRQDLLQTMMNYHSMIFPDLPQPDALGWAIDDSTSTYLYNQLSGNPVAYG